MSAARSAALLALLALLAAGAAAAQTDARTVAGRVVRPGAHGPRPVGGAWVVLHRVGSDTAGPLDSVRTRANGAFAFRYLPSGSPDAVYFLATRHDGIAYISSPLKTAHVTGTDAELTVFDTASGGVTLHERGRHVVVFTPRADGTREIYEVYELSNDGDHTLIPGGTGHPSWSAPLPGAATDFQTEQGDVSAGGMAAVNGRVEVFAPFAPGLKQVQFSYRLPPSAFPLTLPASTDTLVLEVLLEDPGATATGAGLRSMGPQLVDGHHLTRFLSPNAPPAAPVRIAIGARPRARVTDAVLGVVLAIAGGMLVALFAGLRRRG